jgi:hypothetical protein
LYLPTGTPQDDASAPVRRPANAECERAIARYTRGMADEDTVLEEIQDNTREAGQRIRASLNLMRSQGMTAGEDHRELTTRLSTALAMAEAAYLEASKRREM